MDYRIEVAQGDEVKTTNPATRAAALASARRISSQCDDLVYVIGRTDGGDTGQIVYQGGSICDRDGAAI